MVLILLFIYFAPLIKGIASNISCSFVCSTPLSYRLDYIVALIERNQNHIDMDTCSYLVLIVLFIHYGPFTKDNVSYPTHWYIVFVCLFHTIVIMDTLVLLIRLNTLWHYIVNYIVLKKSKTYIQGNVFIVTMETQFCRKWAGSRTML